MRNLLECRDAIDAIDTKLIELLKQRFAVAKDVALYKLAHNQDIVDKTREAQKLDNLAQKAIEAEISPFMIRELYEKLMHHTVLYEQKVVLDNLQQIPNQKKLKVAFLGEQGSYSHLAMHRYFEAQQEHLIEFPLSSFDEIVQRAESGECDYGIIPIENSSSGTINEAIDAILGADLFITGELYLAIDHAILMCANKAESSIQETKKNQDLKALPPLTNNNSAQDAISSDPCSLLPNNLNFDFSQITTVYSHPQPIAQCSLFIKQYLSHAKIIHTHSTTEAMAKVKELNSPHAIAIASMHAANYYGLETVISNIANNNQNYTRFVVVNKRPNYADIPHYIKAKTTLLFVTDKYTPGVLCKILNCFADHNLNMTKINSRPYRLNKDQSVWEECFIVDIEAALGQSEFAQALQDISQYKLKLLKVIGSYVSDEEHLAIIGKPSLGSSIY